MLRFTLLMLALALASARTVEEKEAVQKSIRMKTSRQLKEIFDELGIECKGCNKEALKKKAYKEDAITRWEELHPDKKRKPRPPGSNPDIPGFGGGFGGDSATDDLLRQMRGDFSSEKDPERRRILEKLAKKGMSFGGNSKMSTEELKNMEKMLGGLGSDFKGANFGDGEFRTPGVGAAGDDAPPRATSEIDDVDEEDKMEL